MSKDLCEPYVCFRMFCPNCLEDGWHQSWCDDAGRSEITSSTVQSLPWVWTPVMPAVHPDLPWSPVGVEESAEMFPQLNNTGIIMDGTGIADDIVCEDAMINSVVHESTEGDVVKSELDGPIEGATLLSSAHDPVDVVASETREGATGGSNVSWTC